MTAPRTAPARPYSLEVEEGGAWIRWSTYITRANAAARATILEGKGYTARVVGPPDEPTAAPEPPCPLCDDAHPLPHDGTCLL